MLEIAIDKDQPKAELYAELTSFAAALVDGEPDAIANMANVAAYAALRRPRALSSGWQMCTHSPDILPAMPKAAASW